MMQIPSKLNEALMALAAIAMLLLPLAAQNEPDLQDSGLRFTIRNAILAHEGTLAVFHATLVNRTKQDWYMRSSTVTVSAKCEKGFRQLNVNVHLTNADLASSLAGILGRYATGNSIKPGENDIAERVRADPTCKLDSVGAVRFKGLMPVDGATQESLDSGRDLRHAQDQLRTDQPALDRIIKDDDDRRRVLCHTVYAATANKKLSDLTVTEAQDVQACQRAGYYN